VSVVKAQAEKPVETVAVVIVAPFQTNHEGHVYGPGESATVPAEVAEWWVLNGWAAVGSAVADAPESTGFRAPTTK
jgi:hypothetical protein